MSARTREAISLGVILAAVLGLEAFGLRAGTLGFVLVGVMAFIALAVIVFKVDLQWAGVGAACASCFTLTWNGWFVGPVRPGDVLVLLALICFLLAHPNGAFRTPPWWVKQLAVAIILVAIIQIYFPPDPIYLANRVVLGATGKPGVSTKGSLVSANLGVAFKFVVAVAAIPMAFVGAARVDKRAVRWLAIAFATGAALSGWVAILDHLGTDLGRFLTGLPNQGSRQIGFSNQPNFLAAGATLAVPFAFWLIFSQSRWERWLGVACLPGAALGVYASGSRGGAVCVVAVLAVCVVLHPRTRLYAANYFMAGLFAIGVIAAALPAFGAAILRATRLAGGPSTVGSDSVRAAVGAQGVRDFKHSPIAGIGLQVSTEASQVYTQELASGGLILFVAMSIYLLAGIVTSARLMGQSDLAVALLAAFIATLGLNIFEADLTDRFYYVPAAILIALIEVLEREHVVEDDPKPAITAGVSGEQ